MGIAHLSPCILLSAGLYLDDPRLVIAGAMFAGCLFVAAMIIALVKKWRKKQDVVLPSASDQLSEYRALFEAGNLSKEEFERIRERLMKQIRQETGLGMKADGAKTDGAAPAGAAETKPTLPPENPAPDTQ
jgi:hypothetical protein